MSKTQVVWFRDLNRWDVGFYIDNLISSNHKMVAFGEFLEKDNIEYEILESEKDYPILGVRSYGLGVYHNRIAKGKNLITKTTKQYQKIKAGNLFWCKVDTKNGAFGITDEQHIGYYASNNMMQVKINQNKILPIFLQYLFSCTFFQKFLDKQVAGTTNRQYISFNELKTLQIPLPPLKIQQEIVSKIEGIKAKINALKEKERQLKSEIEAYIKKQN